MTKAKIKNSNDLRKFTPKETGIKETKNLLLKIQIKKSAIAVLYLGIFGFQQTCDKLKSFLLLGARLFVIQTLQKNVSETFRDDSLREQDLLNTK